MDTKAALSNPDYGVASKLAPTHTVTPEQIVFYQEHGYLAIAALHAAE